MKRRRTDEPGRLKWRLAEMLTAEGLIITAYDIDDPKGYWRSSPHADVYRWTARAQAGSVRLATANCPDRARVVLPSDFSVQLFCWETMTECVRRGIELALDSQDIVSHIDESAQ